MNTREKGTEQEQLAATYLEARGMKIAEQNFRCRQGEIDIVGYHNGYLVFVEVKYRKNTQKGSALEAVNKRKQQQICKVADYYRYTRKVSARTGIRYDVVAIQDEKIEWLQNAFPHIYVRG